MVSQFSDNNTVDIKNKRLFSFSSNVVLFFMFLASLNFVNRFAYCVFIAFAAFLVLEWRYIKVSVEVIPLIIFSLSLLVFWPGGNSSITAMLRTFTFPMCFIIGYNLPSQSTGVLSRERSFRIMTIVLALGTWLHLMLNLIINFLNEEAERNTIDFWIGDVLSATGQAALASIMIPVAVACMFSKAKKWLKLLSVVALVTILYYNLILAGRNIIILLIVALLVALVYHFKKSNRIKQNIKALLWVATIALVCVVAYRNNLFGIRDVITDSNFYERFFEDSASTLTEDSRGERKLKYLEYLFEFPFGGANIKAIVGGYAHDLYLDTYDEAGVFAFFAIVTVVIDFAFKTFKVLKNKAISYETKQMLFLVFVVLNIEFWIEPILAGMSWLLACFCIIYGSVCSLVVASKRNEGSDKI